MGFLDSFRVTARYRLEEARRDGLRDGWKEGHKKGLEDGRREGLKEGYKLGYEKGRTEGARDGRREGFLNGVEHGHDSGRLNGLSEGRRNGYSAGVRLGVERTQHEKARAEGVELARRSLREAIIALVRRRLSGCAPRLLSERLGKVLELEQLHAILLAADAVRRPEDVAAMFTATPRADLSGPSWP